MQTNQPTEVTRILAELAEGQENAAARLLPLVYGELRALADRYLKQEPSDHTLQPTALVHEAFLRLVGENGCNARNRAQFFSVAAQAMRHLLIDHARRRRAVKRGGDRKKLPLDDVIHPSEYRDDYLVALDDGLLELANVDPQLCRVVELRFFGGLSVEETAQIIGVAPITVKRMWKMARGWLHREITQGS